MLNPPFLSYDGKTEMHAKAGLLHVRPTTPYSDQQAAWKSTLAIAMVEFKFHSLSLSYTSLSTCKLI